MNANAAGLSRGDIQRIVTRFIGVQDGYLGDFSYRTHAEFYPEYCDLDIDPYEFDGTTRERFIAILSALDPGDQACVIRGLLDRFPLDEGPESRNEEMRDEMLRLAERCDSSGVAPLIPAATSAVVVGALADAETLIRTSGATSGVDRLHTALHGHLKALCNAAEIGHDPSASMGALLKCLRNNHPKLADLGPRPQEVKAALNACASILGALDPVRNQASYAHPSDHLLDEPEAMLVINATRTVLTYLDAKLGTGKSGASSVSA